MKTTLLILAAILMTACSKEDPPPPAGDGPNLSFSSQQPASTSARAVSAQSAPSTPVAGSDFDMGDLKKTSTFLFELRNSGNTGATNVFLATDNPAVTVQPASIGIISPSGSGGLIPIIQVTVAHGLNANGIGTAPCLPQGPFSFTVVAQILGGDPGHPTRDPQPVHGKDNVRTGDAAATIGMTVKVTDFSVKLVCNANPEGQEFTRTRGGNATNPISTSDGYSLSAPVWDADNTLFWDGGVAPAAEDQHGPLTVTNAGNTAITVVRYSCIAEGGLLWPLASTNTVAAGETLTLLEIPVEYPGQLRTYFTSVLRIVGEGAVFTASTIQPNTDGIAWVYASQHFVLIPTAPQ